MRQEHAGSTDSLKQSRGASSQATPYTFSNRQVIHIDVSAVHSGQGGPAVVSVDNLSALLEDKIWIAQPKVDGIRCVLQAHCTRGGDALDVDLKAWAKGVEPEDDDPTLRCHYMHTVLGYPVAYRCSDDLSVSSVPLSVSACRLLNDHGAAMLEPMRQHFLEGLWNALEQPTSSCAFLAPLQRTASGGALAGPEQATTSSSTVPLSGQVNYLLDVELALVVKGDSRSPFANHILPLNSILPVLQQKWLQLKGLAQHDASVVVPDLLSPDYEAQAPSISIADIQFVAFVFDISMCRPGTSNFDRVHCMTYARRLRFLQRLLPVTQQGSAEEARLVPLVATSSSGVMPTFDAAEDAGSREFPLPSNRLLFVHERATAPSPSVQAALTSLPFLVLDLSAPNKQVALNALKDMIRLVMNSCTIDGVVFSDATLLLLPPEPTTPPAASPPHHTAPANLVAQGQVVLKWMQTVELMVLGYRALAGVPSHEVLLGALLPEASEHGVVSLATVRIASTMSTVRLLHWRRRNAQLGLLEGNGYLDAEVSGLKADSDLLAQHRAAAARGEYEGAGAGASGEPGLPSGEPTEFPAVLRHPEQHPGRAHLLRSTLQAILDHSQIAALPDAAVACHMEPTVYYRGGLGMSCTDLNKMRAGAMLARVKVNTRLRRSQAAAIFPSQQPDAIPTYNGYFTSDWVFSDCQLAAGSHSFRFAEGQEIPTVPELRAALAAEAATLRNLLASSGAPFDQLRLSRCKRRYSCKLPSADTVSSHGNSSSMGSHSLPPNSNSHSNTTTDESMGSGGRGEGGAGSRRRTETAYVPLVMPLHHHSRGQRPDEAGDYPADDAFRPPAG